MSREHARPEATARMVRVRTVGSPFHARVLAARLGADGILTELRGNVGGPYPVGETSVWVPEPEAEVARALLLADLVEADLVEADLVGTGPAGADPSGRPPEDEDPGAGQPGASAPRRPPLRRVLAAGGVLAMLAAGIAAHLGL